MSNATVILKLSTLHPLVGNENAIRRRAKSFRSYTESLHMHAKTLGSGHPLRYCVGLVQ